MATTRINNINIKCFRGLKDVQVDIGTQITLICGKNGTSKSSILGIAAQAFSFNKDYWKDMALDYKTITGAPFKSMPSEHFRFSEKFDSSGSMDVEFSIYDGYSNKVATPSLKLYRYRDRKTVRPIIRGNDTVPGINKSRNLTHPVIYLSLNRLTPITFRDYSVIDLEYLRKRRSEFLRLSNWLLNKETTSITATSGTIESAVAHGDYYDHDSVSAGEDNCGQIVQAILSFQKLKEEYADYKGGLLLIDEADAGLFPAAQIELINILQEKCQELNVQVIMTSHSPTMIEKVFALSATYKRKFKTVYLTDTYGKIQSRNDVRWSDIYADLMIDTVSVNEDLSLPKINIYFEDSEAADLFDKIVNNAPIRKILNPLRQVTLGCGNYKNLVNKRVPEFCKYSIIVLDADVEGTKEMSSIILLPGRLPPDQLMFEYMYNQPADDGLWENKQGFSRSVFKRKARLIIERLELTGDVIDLKAAIEKYRRKGQFSKVNNDRLRDLFKDFYKDPDFQKLMKSTKEYSPLKRWVSEHREDCDDFKNKFIGALQRTLQVGFGLEKGKTEYLNVFLT